MKLWAVVLLILLCAVYSAQAAETAPLVTIVKNVSVNGSMALGLVVDFGTKVPQRWINETNEKNDWVEAFNQTVPAVTVTLCPVGGPDRKVLVLGESVNVANDQSAECMPLNNHQAFLIIRQDVWWNVDNIKRVMVEWTQNGYPQVWVREPRIKENPWWQ